MPDTDRLLTIAAFVKFIGGEPMSVLDLERVIKVFDEKPLQVAQVDPAMLNGVQARLRDSLAKYLQPPK